VALLFHHPNLINLNTDHGGQIPAYIVENCILAAISKIQELPLMILQEGDDWMQACRPMDPTISR
jgi:hypothetical protein